MTHLLNYAKNALNYGTRAVVIVATAANLLAADPTKVRTIADYLDKNGTNKEYEIAGDKFSGREMKFQLPNENGDVVINEVTLAHLVENEKEAFVAAAEMYDPKLKRHGYLGLKDSAKEKGLSLDGEIDDAEGGVKVGEVILTEKIDLNNKERRSVFQEFYDNIINNVYSLINKK